MTQHFHFKRNEKIDPHTKKTAHKKKKKLHINIHSNMIDNSPKLEITYMSIKREWLNTPQY